MEMMQIESHTSFESIKGMIMRMTFDNEKTELNQLPKSLSHQTGVSLR